MDVSIILARFWGSLFIILGLLSMSAKLLGRIINYTKDRSITITTGYVTFLLGLITVILHNVWTWDWRVAVTILGWTTLIKGVLKIGFPEHVHDRAQLFKKQQKLWGFVIFLIGAVFFWMSY